MEYRNIANRYLCRRETDHYGLEDLPPIPIEGVRKMLIADKVQNQRDFRKYHLETHDRGKELEAYFILWLKYLYSLEIK